MDYPLLLSCAVMAIIVHDQPIVNEQARTIIGSDEKSIISVGGNREQSAKAKADVFDSFARLDGEPLHDATILGPGAVKLGRFGEVALEILVS